MLGFVIGAGLSIAGRRNNGGVAFATPTPVQSLPSQRVTPAPTEKPTPEPTEGPTQAPTVAATESPAAQATSSATPQATTSASPEAAASSVASASAEPTFEASATPIPKPKAAAATHVAKATPRATAAPIATEEAPSATPLGTRTPHVAPAIKATTVPVASATADASRDFAQLAAAVVRQYLAAVSRGDQDSAYAALGGSPGDRSVQLTEAGIVDAHTKIGRIVAHGAGDAATVNVDLQTPDGTYYGQYTVRRNETGAAVIVQHSIGK